MEHIALIVGGICWERKELDQILAKFEKAPLLCIQFLLLSPVLYNKPSSLYKKLFLFLLILLQLQLFFVLFKEPSGQEKHFAQQLWEEAGLSLERG